MTGSCRRLVTEFLVVFGSGVLLLVTGCSSGGPAGVAVPDLDLPQIAVTAEGPGAYRIDTGPGLPGFGHVLLGLLRAMADDYGALALAELAEDGPAGARLTLQVAEAAFAEGRRFDLAPVGPGGQA